MEHFEDNNLNQKKEKNVYLLHLDAPRILLISTIAIGLLVTTFLVGMNFVGNDNNIADPFNQNRNTINQNGPMISSDELTSSSLDNKEASPVEEKIEMPLNEDAKKAAGNKELQNNSTKLEVITKNDIDEVISPVNDSKKNISKKTSRKTEKRKITNRKKHTIARKTKTSSKKHSRKKRTVKAASGTASGSFVRSYTPSRAYYQIQVASYDTIRRAQKEAGKLKRMNYQVYIDDTVVNNKKFYRVRIGPIKSKQRSLDLLAQIQKHKRYENSYMVKEK